MTQNNPPTSVLLKDEWEQDVPRKFIDEDFVAVRRTATSSGKPFLTLAFGDEVEVIPDPQSNHLGFTKVRALTYFDGTAEGFIVGNPPLRDEGILKMSMVDVQQGDGLVLEFGDRIVLIDGGDNKLFARHVAARFQYRASSEANPLEIEAIIITHGDADHFDGLNEIRRSETLPDKDARKRLFIRPKRVFHNGLVKSPTKKNNVTVAEGDRFGRTVVDGDDLIAIDLVDDPRDFAPEDRSAPFQRWCDSLDHWENLHGPIEMKRVAFGMNEEDLFGFLHDDGVNIELQGPFETAALDPATNDTVPGLAYYNKPKKSAVLHLEQGQSTGGPSASHTINGHSITFRMTFGNVRFAFTGDQNKDSMERMLQEVGEENLEAEIVKAPHHGSHEFDFRALKAMKPIVALVSSGDEDTFHEHIHPRATLMAALGKAMRLDTGVIFSAELAAFFHMRDLSHQREALKKYFDEHETDTFTKEEVKKLFVGKLDDGDPDAFFGFERTNFGIVHIRTDGERVLVFTHSGKEGLNEAYRFTVSIVNGSHSVVFAPTVVTR